MRCCSLRFLLVATAFCAIGLAWYVDRSSLAKQLRSERRQNFLAHESYELRRERIKQLAKSTEKDVAVLLYALSDPDPIVRDAAASILRGIPGSRLSDNPQCSTEFERWLHESEL